MNDAAKKRKRRGVVRLSSVDQRRLESGEINDPYDAVGKPEPLNDLELDESVDIDESGPPQVETGRDTWLKQNVPPHW